MPFCVSRALSVVEVLAPFPCEELLRSFHLFPCEELLRSFHLFPCEELYDLLDAITTLTAAQSGRAFVRS